MLLLELRFELDVFLLKLTNQVFLQLDFLDHLHEIRVGLACFLRELLRLLLNFGHLLDQLGNVGLVGSDNFVESCNRLLLTLEVVAVLVVHFFDVGKTLLHHVSVANETHDVSFFSLGLLAEPLNFTGQCAHGVLGNLLLGNSVLLQFVKTLFVEFECFVFAVELLVVLFELSVAVQEAVDFLLVFGIKFL